MRRRSSRWSHLAGYIACGVVVVLTAELLGYIYFQVLDTSVSNYRPGRVSAQMSSANTASYYDQPHLSWRTEFEPWGAWHVPGAQTRHQSECFDVRYRANSVGARDAERTLDGDGRYLFLGDSVIEGYGVDEEFRITNRMEQHLGVPVLNFSSAEHFGPLNYELLYEGLAGRYAHQHLLVGFLPANDFTDNDAEVWKTLDEDQTRYRPYFDENGNAMYVAPKPRDGVTMKELIDENDALWERRRLKDAREQKKHTGFRGVVQQGVNAVKYFSWIPGFFYEVKAIGQTQAVYSGYRDFTDEQLRTVLLSFERLSNAARERGARMTLIVMPYPGDYGLESAENRLSPRLREWSQSRGIPMLDLLEEFKGRQGMELDCDSHWSNEGNEVAAEAIIQFLESGQGSGRESGQGAQ